jgi:hypothetical protein
MLIALHHDDGKDRSSEPQDYAEAGPVEGQVELITADLELFQAAPQVHT